MRQSHAAQDVLRLGELDICVTDNLDAIAPWVEKVEKRAGQRLDACFGQRLADDILVVDHKPKMTSLVCRLSSTFLQREELVAQVDECRVCAFATKLEVEQLTVEGQSLFDITNFQRYVIETNGARSSCFNHGTLHQVKDPNPPLSLSQALRACRRADSVSTSASGQPPLTRLVSGCGGSAAEPFDS